MNGYCDASYNNVNGIGVIGYRIDNNYILYEEFKGVKNTELELIAVDRLIEKRDIDYPGIHLVINSDCQKACNSLYLNVTMSKINAHKKKSECNERDLLFRQVDIGCRKKLRELSKLSLK